MNYSESGSAVTAVPNAGYHFVNWSDGSTANPRTDANVTANLSVTANFAIDTYTITASAGANGSIAPSGTTVVNSGASQAYTITPATGYHVADVLVDGVTAGAVTSYTFSNVTANHTIAASFAIDTYTLTYTAGANGTISGTSPQTVNYNASGSAVTAVPNTGYHFVNWSDGSTANPRTNASVTADVSVTATFALPPHTHPPRARDTGHHPPRRRTARDPRRPPAAPSRPPSPTCSGRPPCASALPSASS